MLLVYAGNINPRKAKYIVVSIRSAPDKMVLTKEGDALIYEEFDGTGKLGDKNASNIRSADLSDFIRYEEALSALVKKFPNLT